MHAGWYQINDKETENRW